MVTQVRPVHSMPDSRLKSDLLYKEHLFQTFQSLKFIRGLPTMDQTLLRGKAVKLRKRPGYEGQKTVVFDLDETLVHCVEDIHNNPDAVIRIQFPNGVVMPVGVNIRPYVKECLEEANKNFEVIVFTASQKCYADVVLNLLDPTGKLIHHRLYRENCIPVQGVLVKDLRILLGRQLKDIVIVDNATYSFGYQLDNGVPIISWHDDYCDKELFNLIDYLNMLANANDVREINSQTFHLKTFYEDYLNEFVRKSN